MCIRDRYNVSLRGTGYVAVTTKGDPVVLDVAGAGTLAISASTTIDGTLQAKGSAAPAVNTAAANYTIDVNGDSAPPVSSSASITLIQISTGPKPRASPRLSCCAWPHDNFPFSSLPSARWVWRPSL